LTLLGRIVLTVVSLHLHYPIIFCPSHNQKTSD
jgi:hypothetical protein